MNGGEQNKRHVKGIIHCHTNLSFDGTIPLETLCAVLNAEGFDFVAITDHAKGVTDDQYRSFVDACRKISTDSFVAIPGLEVRLSDGNEIAAVGVNEFIHATDMQDVVDNIQQQGGYSIWVHPFKRGRNNLKSCDCNAIEILNGKQDGTAAPNLSLFIQSKRIRRTGKKVHVIFGADAHHIQAPMMVWTECEVITLSESEIINALKAGDFLNKVARIKITSNGNMPTVSYGLLLLTRLAYIIWNLILEKMPDNLRQLTVRASRKLVLYLKGCA